MRYEVQNFDIIDYYVLNCFFTILFIIL